MTVQEVISALAALPREARDKPVVGSMWTADRQDFVALGDTFGVYFAPGDDFAQVMAHDPALEVTA